MTGEDHFRGTTRERPVNVIPDADGPRTHIYGGHCPCLPTLETWTIRGVTTHRLMHRRLTPPQQAPEGS